ncbi:hypothetical protein [Pseudemcibacter aquimaris]|uniref:hypothetical protein n=1 Tax=Pseudemcibacter aquimaris TaxID=2857064 RepID=UPI002012699D|nr:hypothetical protein [Pseudemcibacter aquimaris]MCC3860224.1 hypothetical protein [Pseudemcibacter aquimaris]WDU57549.1 hypothetical protein KW060_10115 [Pseudemcibacter aquimaris]
MIKKSFVILILLLSTVSANAQKTGEYILTSTPEEVLGHDAEQFKNIIDANANLSWEVYVPKRYNPDKPAGIMVFAGAPNDVRPPRGWYSSIEDKNLIWIAPRRSGNGSTIQQKTMLAMMAVLQITKRYSINPDRIYISGEPRIASRAALNYPNIFKGAIFSSLNYGDNNVWDENADEKIQNALDNKFVFVSSSKTRIPQTIGYAYHKFVEAGVRKVEFLLLNSQGRIVVRFDRRRILKAINMLDQ